jgi:hypothetical protein
MNNEENSEVSKENTTFERVCDELGEDVVRQLLEAYRLTAAALFNRAKEHAEAKLHEEQPK